MISTAQLLNYSFPVLLSFLLLFAIAASAQSVASGDRLLPDPDDVTLLYDREHAAIGYDTTRPTDPIARLQKRLNQGKMNLEYDSSRGYLGALLAVLGIDIESQLLVYSRTSLNFANINPQNPRAIYFNDDTYLAWVPGLDTIEIASMDPLLGPVFYTLTRDSAQKPDFVRQSGKCLRCHDSLSLTGGGVPRFLLGSGYTNEIGNLVSHEGWIVTNQTTPLKFRGGGWYVTGQHGNQVHLGNIIIKNPQELQDLEGLRNGNLDSLEGMLPAGKYPGNYSDIVALLLIEHQVHIQNLITRVSYDVRKLIHQNSAAGTLPEEVQDLVVNSVEPLVSAMFMLDAATLTDKVSGNPGFTRKFEARGPFDSQGRSLRQLDLEKSLFRYPLSYLIYSEAFANLPDIAREKIYIRIKQIVNGQDSTEKYSYLTESDRSAILGILEQTLPGIM